MDSVIDASVAIKLFLVEPLSDRADALFATLAGSSPARFYVPGLLYLECANILWKYVRRYSYPAESARRDIAGLLALPLQAVPTADLVQEALDIALRYGATAYDATYVALAQRLSLPLVTADEALVHRLAGGPPIVKLLAYWGKY